MSILDLYAGTEDLGLGEEGAVQAVESVAAEVSEIRAEVAEINAELQEQGDVIDEVAEQIDDVVEASEDVVEAVEGMESLIKNGNFDNVAFAALYNRAYKTCVRSLGGAPAKGLSRIGAEDLYDSSTAVTLARDGMEGLMDRVKGAGATVLEFIKRIFNWVANFFIGLFNKNKKLLRRAELLTTDLDKADLKLKEKVKLGGWNGYIDYEAKGLAGKALDLIEAQSAVGEYAGLLDGEITEAEFKSKYGSLVSAMKGKIGSFTANKEAKEGEKKNFIGQFAGIRIAFTSAEDEIKDLDGAAKAAKALGFKVVKADTYSKLSTGEVAPKADKAVLKGVVGNVVKHLRALENGKVDQKFAGAKRDKLIGYINAAGKDEDAGKKVALVKAVASSASSMTKTFMDLCSDLCEAYLNGVAAHV